MEIKIEIGTRGYRVKFRKTYTREFLEDKGLMQLNNDSGPYSPWAVHTKLGWMCSFSDHDVLTYMGHGIWDLKPIKQQKVKMTITPGKGVNIGLYGREFN